MDRFILPSADAHHKAIDLSFDIHGVWVPPLHKRDGRLHSDRGVVPGSKENRRRTRRIGEEIAEFVVGDRAVHQLGVPVRASEQSSLAAALATPDAFCQEPEPPLVVRLDEGSCCETDDFADR